MQAADGHSDSAEKLMNTFTFENLDISKEELIYARDMSNIEAFTIIRNMLPHEKRYVTAMLGTLIVIDKDIDDKELELWRLISSTCELPSMNLNDAPKIYSEFIK